MKDSTNHPKTFVTSDQHFDHANIIKYCNRQFSSVEKMNNVLLNNWNNTIKDEDTVYFLGDLAFGTSSRPTDYWLKQLKGKIIFIKGNHDKSKNINFLQHCKLQYGKYSFFLTHDPVNAPKNWDGWIIHGHHHNHYTEYPFINKEKRTINVSVELTDYKPVDMDDMIKKIEDS